MRVRPRSPREGLPTSQRRPLNHRASLPIQTPVVPPLSTVTRDADPLRELPVFRWLLRHAPRRVHGAGLPAGVGMGLLLLTGTLIAVSAPFLGVADHDVLALLLGALALAVLGVVGAFLPWRRWPRRLTVVIPVLGLGTLVTLGAVTDGIGALAFVSLIPLSFVYLGIFHRLSAAVLTLPVAWAAYVSLVGPVTASTVVRLLVYGAVWLTISGTIAALVARQRAVRRALERATETDPLTALGNRLGLEARLLSASPGDCVVLCDLDHFKSINDSFGHGAGDEVLESFGRLLTDHLRRRDYAARFGGEEFALVLAHTDPSQAVAALAALREEWLDLAVGVTFSAGIAAVTQHRTPHETLEAADRALYDAKAAGRDRVRVADAVDVDDLTVRRAERRPATGTTHGSIADEGTTGGGTSGDGTGSHPTTDRPHLTRERAAC